MMRGCIHTHTHLDTVGMERRSEEHVQKEELSSYVGDVEQFDEEVDNDQVLAITVVSTRKSACSSTNISRHVNRIETAQISTTQQPAYSLLIIIIIISLITQLTKRNHDNE